MGKRVRYLYEFGPFRLDPDERVLMRGEHVLSLTPKALETLIVLVERSRHVLSKDELMSRIWPDIFVEEANLAQYISMLRKALGEREDGGQYIETVPKRGYRFSIKVTKVMVEITGTELETRVSRPESIEIDKGRKPDTAAPESSRPSSGRSIEIKPGVRLGRYEIISQLGSGGMGEIFLVNDTQLDRRVALKLLSEKFTQNAPWLKRFIHEAKTVSSLNHPNIITIHEIGSFGGVHFIATEYVEGQTLRRLLASGQVKLRQALDVAIQVTSALAAAHSAGIVHRDLKPENVMVRPDGYIKVLDFGLAKQIDQEPAADDEGRISRFVTDPGTIMGTVNYMSPEQARGLAVDTRSDVFSLGVVVYEMITGRIPFDGRTTSDVIVSILDREPPRLALSSKEIPSELERIVLKALRKDREERYQTIKDLNLDLKSLLQELEIRAKLGDSWPDMLLGGRKDVAPGPTELATSGSGIDLHQTHSSGEFQVPEVRYARSGDVNIAYQVIGNAPLDLVFVMGWVSHLEYFWSEPSFARFLRRLSSFVRVILFDKRGTGLSDSVPLDQLPTLEQRMEDVRVVMDAVGSARAVLCGISEGGPMCSLFAATYPEKTMALLMIGSYARRLRGKGYPWGPTEEEQDRFFEEIRENWGGPVGLKKRAPSMADDPHFREWWAAYLRHGASPAAALALTKMNAEIDIRHVLPSVRVPSLIIHRTGDLCLKVEEGRYLADNIPGAKFVELPGDDHLPFVGDQDAILDEIEEFVTGVRQSSQPDRILLTVLAALVTDQPGGGKTDAQWLDLLDLHHSFVRKEIELYKGRAMEVAGDHLLATFDGPARAIRSACAISDAARRLGVNLRSGLHTGECDVLGDRINGLAVELAADVAKLARPGEVLVSNTVKDLVAGSGIAFLDRGTTVLRQNLGECRLFAVDRRN